MVFERQFSKFDRREKNLIMYDDGWNILQQIEILQRERVEMTILKQIITDSIIQNKIQYMIEKHTEKIEETKTTRTENEFKIDVEQVRIHERKERERKERERKERDRKERERKERLDSLMRELDIEEKKRKKFEDLEKRRKEIRDFAERQRIELEKRRKESRDNMEREDLERRKSRYYRETVENVVPNFSFDHLDPDRIAGNTFF